MDTTIAIKVSQKDKIEPLLEFLRSIDYISSIEYFDELLEFKKKLNEVNQAAEATDLSQMTLDEVNEEIKGYRTGK